MLYLDHIDDLDGVRAEFERNPIAKAVTGRTYFFILYRHGKYDDALKLLDQIPRTGNEGMYYMRRGYALANLKDNGPARALDQFKEAWRVRGDGRNRIAVYAPTILFLLGKRAEGVKVYGEMFDATAKQSSSPSFYASAYEYWAERRSEAKLLEEAGQSRWMQCEAHFYIGIKVLADGDRIAARDHFQKSVDTRVLWYLEYEWSRALLGQMQDPTWPPWIPGRTEKINSQVPGEPGLSLRHVQSTPAGLLALDR